MFDLCSVTLKIIFEQLLISLLYFKKNPPKYLKTCKRDPLQLYLFLKMYQILVGDCDGCMVYVLFLLSHTVLDIETELPGWRVGGRVFGGGRGPHNPFTFPGLTCAV